MDAVELSILFTKIASQIKLCKCGLSANNLSNSHIVSSLSSILNGEKNRFKCISSLHIKSENSDKSILPSKDENMHFLKTTCPNCSSDISLPEKEVILKMQSAFYHTLQDIGINLESLTPPKTAEDLTMCENANYEVKCDAKYLKRNAKGETLLHTAARKKDVQSVVMMLRNNVNPNTQDNAGWTPLHEAVFDDNYEITLELLSAGAIVNVPGYDFTTPLHAATHHNNLQMVQLLLKFGADPTARDISGRCPEFYAKDPEIVSLLKEYSTGTDIIDMARRFQKKAAPRPIIIYISSTDASIPYLVNRLENKLDIRFAPFLSKEVTHMVVDHFEDNVCESTFEVMKAVLMGCIIVNKNWLYVSDMSGRLVNFSEYEVNGTVKYSTDNGPRKARNNFLNLRPPLFTGCHIFLKKMKNIYYVKNLVSASGAKLLTREPNPEHAPANYFLYHCPSGHTMESTSTLILYQEGSKEPKIKYNMKHIKSLPVSWFFDCIQTFTIRDPASQPCLNT